jgi:restriction system protein
MKKRKKNKVTIEMLVSSLFSICLLTYFYTDSINKTITTGIVLVIVPVIYALISLWLKLVKNRKKENQLRMSGINEIDHMDGFQFEYYLAALFKALGYKVEVTKATGDFGADLILKNEQEKIVVQAKRYSSKISNKAIQEIYTSMSHYNATSAWVVTNNFFTKPAIELANSTGVKLVDRKDLIDLIIKVNPSGVPSAKEVREQVTPKQMHCPKCDSKMVLREGSYGKFYGCSKYPKCNGKRDYK